MERKSGYEGSCSLRLYCLPSPLFPVANENLQLLWWMGESRPLSVEYERQSEKVKLLTSHMSRQIDRERERGKARRTRDKHGEILIPPPASSQFLLLRSRPYYRYTIHSQHRVQGAASSAGRARANTRNRNTRSTKPRRYFFALSTYVDRFMRTRPRFGLIVLSSQGGIVLLRHAWKTRALSGGTTASA